MHWNHKTFNHLVGRRSFSHSAFVMAPRLLLQSGSDFLSLPFFQFPAQKNNKLILMNWKNKDKKTAAAYEMENHSGWRGDSRFLATPARIFHTKLFIFPFDSSPHVFLSLCRLLKVFLLRRQCWNRLSGKRQRWPSSRRRYGFCVIAKTTRNFRLLRCEMIICLCGPPSTLVGNLSKTISCIRWLEATQTLLSSIINTLITLCPTFECFRWVNCAHFS